MGFIHFEGETERKKNINELPLIGFPTGDQTHNPSMCPDGEPLRDNAPTN